MVNAPVEIEHVDHKTAKEAVNHVADDSGIKKRLGNQRQPIRSKHRLALSKQKRKRDEAKDGERPDLALEHSPGATAILDVGEIEKARNNGNRRGPLEASRGEFLDDRIHEHEVRDGGEDDEEPLHFCSRSIALWHSMHVSTNGWFRSRGLRMSCPHEVQTP